MDYHGLPIFCLCVLVLSLSVCVMGMSQRKLPPNLGGLATKVIRSKDLEGPEILEHIIKLKHERLKKCIASLVGAGRFCWYFLHNLRVTIIHGLSARGLQTHRAPGHQCLTLCEEFVEFIDVKLQIPVAQKRQRTAVIRP